MDPEGYALDMAFARYLKGGRRRRVDEARRQMDHFPIDAGEVASAKYWNKDPSAICVYSLDRNRGKVLDILESLGAGKKRVWEYDYAMDKNLQDPIVFIYSWTSKFRTILQSYGIAGTLRLVRELLKPR